MPNIIGTSSVLKLPNAIAVVNPSINHTIESGTKIILLAIGIQANDVFVSDPRFSGLFMTKVGFSTPSGASADTQVTLWGYLDPPVGLHTFSWIHNSTPSSVWATLDNWADVNSASFAAAIAQLGDGVNNAVTNSLLIPDEFNAGIAPNAVVAWAGFVGGDGGPVTNSDGFADIHNDNTGGGAGNVSDHTFYVAQKATGLPSDINLQFQQTDENAGILMQLFLPTSAGPVIGPSSDQATSSVTSSGTCRTNDPTGTMFAVVTQSVTTPTHDQIVAGQDHNGAPADAIDSLSPPEAEGIDNEFTFVGLAPGTLYWTHYTQLNAALLESVPVSATGFQTILVGTLSNAADDQTGTTTSAGSVESNVTNGTVWGVVTQSAVTPSHAQIVAGQDELGAPADAAANVGQIIGVINLFFSGLVSATAYFTHFTSEDIGGEPAFAPVSADGFTTSAFNATPVVDAPIVDQVCTIGTAFGPLDISGNFSDPDGDPLVFSSSGLPNGLTCSPAGIITGTPTGGFQDDPPGFNF